jgi:hypothetical protein
VPSLPGALASPPPAPTPPPEAADASPGERTLSYYDRHFAAHAAHARAVHAATQARAHTRERSA